MTTNDIYPITLIKDRYTGAYSGGKWTAWHMDADQIPNVVFTGDDASVAWFWRLVDSGNELIVGRGDTPDEAIEDLRRRMKNG